MTRKHRAPVVGIDEGDVARRAAHLAQHDGRGSNARGLIEQHLKGERIGGLEPVVPILVGVGREKGGGGGGLFGHVPWDMNI